MIKTTVLDEAEFRSLVEGEHRAGHFRGDPHSMQVKFKRHARSVDFFGVRLDDDQTGELVAFCGLDIYPIDNGRETGFIHCQGVPKGMRGNGYSVLALHAVRDIGMARHPSMTQILSICNPISERSHVRAGYAVIHPGRLSPSGKRMQIRLKLSLGGDR